MIDNINISRDFFLEKINKFIGGNIIKIITGQRRVGKSYLMKQLLEIVNIPYVYINKELYEFDSIKNYKDLIDYVEKVQTSSELALFIDEIQDIDVFENALRHFQAKGGYDIYCTGSNAKLLSGELATYLSGRYVQFNIHSLSFTEFKKFHNNNNFIEYVKYGGMPYLKHLPLESDTVYQYLRDIFESIVLKDVVARYNLRNIKFLSNLVKYLCTNVGSITSSYNVSQFLKSQKLSISVSSVINYIEALKNCYFIYEVPRYDIVGKKIFEINSKYYFEDIGIRNSIVGYNEARDAGKLLENIVFMHLLRSGYKVYVGVIKNREIDFIAEKNNEKIYIQVCLKVTDESVLAREFGNFLLIKDNYPKCVVSQESSSINTFEGVKHISVEDFLQMDLSNL